MLMKKRGHFWWEGGGGGGGEEVSGIYPLLPPEKFEGRG